MAYHSFENLEVRQRTEIRDRRSEVQRKVLRKRRDEMRINSAKDLNVYKMAYARSMEIYNLSKAWPTEERYSLTDQIRRSSRSVCANLREA